MPRLPVKSFTRAAFLKKLFPDSAITKEISKVGLPKIGARRGSLKAAEELAEREEFLKWWKEIDISSPKPKAPSQTKTKRITGEVGRPSSFKHALESPVSPRVLKERLKVSRGESTRKSKIWSPGEHRRKAGSWPGVFSSQISPKVGRRRIEEAKKVRRGVPSVKREYGEMEEEAIKTARSSPTWPRPKPTLTKPQWRVLLERTMEWKTKSPMQEAAGREIMGTQQPGQTETFGRLYEGVSDEFGLDLYRRPLDMPYLDAQDLLSKHMIQSYKQGRTPRLSAATEKVPTARLLDPSGFRERIYKKVNPNEAAKNLQAYTALEKEELRLARKQQREQAKALVKKEEALEKVKPKGVERSILKDVPLDDLVGQQNLAQQVWKFIGGGRSTLGRLWGTFSKSAKGYKKGQQPKAEIYFIRQFLKFYNDPEAFTKTYPARESDSLKAILQDFMEAME